MGLQTIVNNSSGISEAHKNKKQGYLCGEFLF